LLLIAPWFATFLAIKGSYFDARMDDASFFRILLPAFPAFVLLMAAVPLLFPGARAQPAPAPSTVLRGRRLLAAAAAAFAVFAIFPVVVIAGARHVGDEAHMLDYTATLVPVRDLGLKATTNGGAVRLTWKSQHASPAKTFYTVLRTNQPDAGVTCAHVTDASVDCRLVVDNSFPTRVTSLTDSPGKGTWSYRVTVSANWVNDTQLGDAYVVSPPVAVTVP
jgi:hypothetical protein